MKTRTYPGGECEVILEPTTPEQSEERIAEILDGDNAGRQAYKLLLLACLVLREGGFEKLADSIGEVVVPEMARW